MSILDEKIRQVNEADRFILLLLGAKNFEAVPGPLHLQHEVYLLRNLFPKLEFWTDYEPCNLGPYSEIVAERMDQLISSDLITKKPDGIHLSHDGIKVYNMLAEKAEKREVQKTEEFKELLNDLSRDELLAFTYFSFPSKDYGKKSSLICQMLGVAT